METPPSTAAFWKRKLAAFLHDPPEKALDIAWHKHRAEAHQSGHALDDIEFAHEADHTAAAADRLPWPTYKHLACSFDGRDNFFKHPLGQASLKFAPFVSADIATTKAWSSRPKLPGDSSSPQFDHRAQNVPAETLFYSVVHASSGRSVAHRDRQPNAALDVLAKHIEAHHATLQIGGDATTGLGYCTARLA